MSLETRKTSALKMLDAYDVSALAGGKPVLSDAGCDSMASLSLTIGYAGNVQLLQDYKAEIAVMINGGEYVALDTATLRIAFESTEAPPPPPPPPPV